MKSPVSKPLLLGGHAHDAVAQVPACKTFGKEQPATSVRVHVAAARSQQATKQGFGSHVPGRRPVGQFSAVVKKQTDEPALQHAPVQGLGVQTLPSSMYTPVHPARPVMVQVLEFGKSQHAPRRHWFGEQVRVDQASGARQFDSSVTVQSPVRSSQHAPMQGLGVQVPLRTATPQPGSLLMRQVSVIVSQQAPVHWFGVQEVSSPR